MDEELFPKHDLYYIHTGRRIYGIIRKQLSRASIFCKKKRKKKTEHAKHEIRDGNRDDRGSKCKLLSRLHKDWISKETASREKHTKTRPANQTRVGKSTKQTQTKTNKEERKY